MSLIETELRDRSGLAGDRSELVGESAAGTQLQRARWAALAFASFDHDRTAAITTAVAEVAYRSAQQFAAATLAATGSGVSADKALTLREISRCLSEHRADADYVSIKLDSKRQLVTIPKPVGVILGLVGATNPVATIYRLTLSALQTRNAIVFVADPEVHGLADDAVTLLGRAAVAAGAPDGCVQIVEQPSPALIERLTAASEFDLLIAEDDNRFVGYARRSTTPSLTAAAGNVPVLIDATADLTSAAQALISSKAFDNSLLSTNESTAIVELAALPALLGELERRGAFLIDAEQVEKLRERCYPNGVLDLALNGTAATAVAATAGIKVPPETRLLVAPVEFVAPEDPLVYAKRYPLLALVAVSDIRRGIAEACAVQELGEAGRSAVIHSREPDTIVAFGAALKAEHIIVNGPGSNSDPISPAAIAGPRQFVRWTECSVRGELAGSFDNLQPAPAAVPTTARLSDLDDTEQNR